MQRKAFVVSVAFLILTVCCQDKKVPGDSGKKKAGDSAAIEKTYYSCQYSGGKWLNGVNSEEKNKFFLKVAKDLPTPIKAGFRLKFAAAGIATARNVFRLEKDDHSLIFVSIDKQLDPTKDGYPSPIFLSGYMIKSSSYSDGRKWKNGIKIANQRIFLFTLPKGDSFSLRKGALLLFRHSGKARVERFSRSQKKDGSQLFTIQVDRNLDPDADGYPHEIEMTINE